MVRKIDGRQPGDPMKDLNANLLIWGMFMKTTLRAAVHLQKNYDTNLHHAKNHLWDSLGQLFGEIKRLIFEQSEILGPRTPEIVGLKTIEFEETTWRSTSLLCERAYQITTAQVYVFSDSVLCMGEMRGDPNAAWMNKIFKVCAEQPLQGIESNRWYADGVRVKNIPRIHDVWHTRRDSKIDEKYTV